MNQEFQIRPTSINQARAIVLFYKALGYNVACTQRNMSPNEIAAEYYGDGSNWIFVRPNDKYVSFCSQGWNNRKTVSFDKFFNLIPDYDRLMSS